MSQLYRFHVTVNKVKPTEVVNINKALSGWFDSKEASYYSSTYCNQTECSISDYPDSFATSLATDVWEALKRFVEISITSTYLENLPFEEHCFDSDTYKDLIPASDRRKWKNKK